MTTLAVWKAGDRIGTITETRRALTFIYAPAACASGLGRPVISVALPTQVAPYRGARVRAFFDGLLPEGDTRQMLAYDLGLDPGDVIGLLAALGRDCAGALVILPDDEEPAKPGAPTLITDDDVAERLRALRFSPLGIDERVRVSLAGVQEKLLLARVGDRWALPIDGAPSTHILKPPHPFLHGSVANEACAMRLCHHSGLAVAPVEVRVVGGIEVLVIERYDRARRPDGTVVRLHQEDLCQAQSLETSRKYEQAGGATLRGCARTVRDWTADPDAELDAMLRWLTAVIIVGNADAHAKNLSLLHTDDGAVRLAPTYDMLCTTVYAPVSTTLGMAVNGHRRIDGVRVDDIVAEGCSWGIRPAAARRIVDDLVARAPAALDAAARDTSPSAELISHIHARVAGIQ